ncbi:hypothetical protein GCM10019995_07730 [Lactobacillus kefiranofaciens subsp. kefirgranum]
MVIILNCGKYERIGNAISKIASNITKIFIIVSALVTRLGKEGTACNSKKQAQIIPTIKRAMFNPFFIISPD